MAEQTSYTTEQIMEQAQVFASAWSLVGGCFDSGDGLERAEREKAELRAMVAAHVDSEPDAPTNEQPDMLKVLEQAERFISGFEDDEEQEVGDLLFKLRALLAGGAHGKA